MIYSLNKKNICSIVIILTTLLVSINTHAQCPQNIDTLATYNIALADIPEQIPVVKKWLENPYSGYPALLIKICSIMDNHKLIGDAPSLMVINHENLVLNQRDDGNPITDEDQIVSNRLEQAIVEAWKQKNAGLLSSLPANPTFNNILK